MTTFISTHAELLWFVAAALLILLAAKRIGDRRLSRTLAEFDAEVARDRAGRQQAGVVAMDALGRSANR